MLSIIYNVCGDIVIVPGKDICCAIVLLFLTKNDYHIN